MKLKIFICSIIFIIAGSVAGLSPVFLHQAVDGSPDLSTITLWWRCEALDFDAANGTTDYSAGDDIATATPDADCTAGANKTGTNGLDLPTAGDIVEFTNTNIIVSSEGRVGFWVKPINRVDGALLVSYHDDSDNLMALNFYSTDELWFYWEDNNTVATTFTTNTNCMADGEVWKFVEFAWKVSAGDTDYREIWVDGISQGSSTAAMAAFAAETGTLYIGDLFSAGQDLNIDQTFIVSSSSTTNLYALRNYVEYPN